VPDGERGAVVYTHLWRTSQPMIRFAPGDAAVMTHDPCPCGRTYPRLEGGVLGRLDDMLVVRGVNVYPSAIEHALRSVDGLGLEFRVFVDRDEAMDEISVQAELAADGVGEDARDQLRQRAADALRYHCQVRVGCELVAPGTFERATLKARRVVDRRARVA
jgi:phenylacetate-CoA ligase